MHSTFRRIAILGSALLLLSLGVVLVNQTAQVVALAGTVHPALGRAVLWALLAGYAVLLGVPLILLLRLPPRLTPPATAEAPEFPRHLAALRRRLRDNPHLGPRARSLSTACTPSSRRDTPSTSASTMDTSPAAITAMRSMLRRAAAAQARGSCPLCTKRWQGSKMAFFTLREISLWSERDTSPYTA